MISIDPRGPTFHLVSSGTSYVMTVVAGKYLAHGYWGARLHKPDPSQLVPLLAAPYLVVEPSESGEFERYQAAWRAPKGSISDPGQIDLPPAFSPDLLPLEYPVYGTGTLGTPAFLARAADGGWANRLDYRSHRIVDGLPGPVGLPYAQNLSATCQTLEIDLADPQSSVTVTLSYAPLPDIPVLLRWARITNAGDDPIELHNTCSASVDLPRADLDMVTLNGAWARERQLHRRPLAPGVQQVDSRGGASGHQHAPFLALLERATTETAGQVWAISLMYSGNHLHLAEVSQYGRTRLQSGLNSFAFSYPLAPGESFDTPAAALVCTPAGLSGMSDAWHRFVRGWLLPERWRDADRPIVLNTWEAHYFEVDADKIVSLAARGADAGAEVLVLDDGWFVGRDDDCRALGDWRPDPRKFPDGLASVAEAVILEGLRFGIWVEPEMVSPDSELFRAHPDWVLHLPNRDASISRNQLVLDLSRDEVVDYLIQILTGLLNSAPISYVKWDMNRNMTEVGSGAGGPQLQGSVMHRYMLGLYRLLGALTSGFPDVMFEGCAGGGGRLDFGALVYTPVFWTSDQTDAAERQRIQFGSTLLFPPETLGAHVSAVPNHQLGRTTPAVTRGLTALAFALGYELDLAVEPEENMRLYARLSELYKEYRRLFRTGRFVRLIPGSGGAIGNAGIGSAGVDNPVSGAGRIAWAIVSPDLETAFVFYFQTLAGANTDGGHLRIHGLDENAQYRDKERGVVFDAVLLRDRGLWLPPAFGDFRSAYWILQRVRPGMGRRRRLA